MKAGHLSHIIDKDGPHLAGAQNTERIIDIICGGHVAGGASNNSQKLYAWEVNNLSLKKPRRGPTPTISFTDEHYPPGLIDGHQDALVITIKIGSNTVKKILIDNDSSVDVLYPGAYSRVNLGDHNLSDAKNTPL